MKFQVRLYSTPSKLNQEAIEKAMGLNSIMFPGCEIPPFQRDHLWLAYSEEEELAGFATMRVLDGLNKGTAYFDRVGVLRRFRGNALQKRFIVSRLRYAKSIGIETLVTYTVLDNYASINSLMHKGFSIYKPQYAWAGHEMLYFKYDLKENK